MKKIVVGSFVAAIFIAASYIFIHTYNMLVQKEENVNVAYSQIQSNIQRELDLIPNLIKVVQKNASYEQSVLQNITKFRTDAYKTLNNKEVSAKNIKNLQNVQKRLDSTVIKLLSVAENYPQLQATEAFLQLQSQIEGAQNRINIARMQYNKAVGIYNTYLKSFPANLVAKIASFKQKPYFQSSNTTKTFKWNN